MVEELAQQLEAALLTSDRLHATGGIDVRETNKYILRAIGTLASARGAMTAEDKLQVAVFGRYA